MIYTFAFEEITKKDFSRVGGKNYGLKMLLEAGVKIPRGVAVAADVFQEFIKYNHLENKIPGLEKVREGFNPALLQEEIKNSKIPPKIAPVLTKIYKSFQGKSLAIRSSANFEDLKKASFSGQYESYLNVKSRKEFFQAVRACFASTFSPRALDYMASLKINPQNAAMALVVQEVAEAFASGVIFTVHPSSLHPDLLYLEANFGFGESVVGNLAEPDRFLVYKPALAVVQKTAGEKKFVLVKNPQGGLSKKRNQRDEFCLSGSIVKKLSQVAARVEKLAGIPQNLEFVVGEKGEVTFVQTRPQIIDQKDYLEEFVVAGAKSEPLATGTPGIPGVASGKIVFGNKEPQKEKIPVLEKIEVYDLPKLKNSAGLIVKNLGLGSHAASVLRELKLPTLIKPKGNLKSLQAKVCTLDTMTTPAKVFAGKPPVKKNRIYFSDLPRTKTKIFVGCSFPAALYGLYRAPIDGVGLIRSEFIVNSAIGIHPQALLDFDQGRIKGGLGQKIEKAIQPYSSGREFFVEKLAFGVASILALLSGKPANYRLCDFQTISYIGLLGGEKYEEVEENPMMGFRGTTRLLSTKFEKALQMELEALKRVYEMGFVNLRIMTPFCRLPEDGRKIKQKIRKSGILKSKIGVMVELASNVFLARDFAEIFDFFFVGPRDLTQTIYGADRTLPELSKYGIDTPAPKEAVLTFFKNIKGREKEVFIALFGLFKHLADYRKVSTNNKIYFSGSASTILKDIRRVYQLEQSLGA